MSLKGQVALVTGSSRGIGKGIAVELGRAGAIVYVTGRSAAQRDDIPKQSTLQEVAEQITASGGKGIAINVDHSDAQSVKKLFEQIAQEQNGRLDILVNNAYAAVNFITENIGTKFWEIEGAPEAAFDVVNNVGLRNHYVSAVYAARLMVARGRGLIVNIGSLGGISYFLNVSYGIGKGAIDRLTSDAAVELKDTGVTVLSLWPGAVKTESIQHTILGKEGGDSAVRTYFEEGESIYYPGKCIVHLASLPDLKTKNGQIITTTQIAEEVGLKDEDGKIPSDPHVIVAKDYIKITNDVRTAPQRK